VKTKEKSDRDGCIGMSDSDKSIVHRIHRYPAFIIEKKDVYSGWDRTRI
jgi:hypothetical protein